MLAGQREVHMKTQCKKTALRACQRSMKADSREGVGVEDVAAGLTGVTKLA